MLRLVVNISRHSEVGVDECECSSCGRQGGWGLGGGVAFLSRRPYLCFITLLLSAAGGCLHSLDNRTSFPVEGDKGQESQRGCARWAHLRGAHTRVMRGTAADATHVGANSALILRKFLLIIGWKRFIFVTLLPCQYLNHITSNGTKTDELERIWKETESHTSRCGA
jgi:hypothetical protein